MLKITLFGTPQITLDGHSLSKQITGRKLSLLIYLITTGRPHSRDVLANLFWSHMTNRRARKHLRDTLSKLRRDLNQYVIVGGDMIAFNRKPAYWLDVEVFGNYVGSELVCSNLKLLHEVLDLYQDDFLRGFYVRNAPMFEQWVVQERERLQKQALEGLFFLANRYFAQKNYKVALLVNRRLLALEPWREDAHQLQMKLLVQDGQRHAALEQYDRCRKILAEEYEIEPLPETTELYEQIKSDYSKKIPKYHLNRYDHTSPPSLSAQPVINWQAMPSFGPFYGREEELTHLESWLLKQNCQLVSLYGMVGQGKSALVANLVQKLAGPETQSASPSNPFDYILWYSLIDQPRVAQLLHFFLQKLLPLERKIPETTGERYALLLECLQRQRCLLVLDHVEQLIPTGKEALKRAHEYELNNELWRWLAQNSHQSCLILISRILPHEIARLSRHSEAVRTICLRGITLQTGMRILRQTAWPTDDAEMTTLLSAYSGNPLALTQLKEAIQDLSPDEIEFFLSDGPLRFDALQNTLNQQLAALSAAEYDLLVWLAIINKPINLKTLWKQLIEPHPKQNYLAAQRTLQRYDFLQNEAGQLTLNPLLRFYLTHHLAKAITDELLTYQETEETFDLFSRYLAQQQDSSGSLLAKIDVTAFKKWQKEQSTTLTYLKRYRLSFTHHPHHHADETSITSNLSLLHAVLRQLLSHWDINQCREKIRQLLIKEQKKEAQKPSYLEENLNHLLSFLTFILTQQAKHNQPAMKALTPNPSLGYGRGDGGEGP